MDNVKAGVKTTEFWMALAAVMVPFIANRLDINFPTDSLLAIISYIITRGWLKAKAASAAK